MKNIILSLVRHALTALAGVGTFLAGRGLIAPEDAAAVNASGATIQDALAVVAVAVIARLMIHFGVKIFSMENEDGNGGSALLLLLGVAGLMGLGLPSCSPQQIEAAKNVPVKACYEGKNGNKVCYGSKSGIEVEVISAK
jgi:hypothetical protein